MLQKNVLEYLENTARRFPDKLAFSDEGRSFSFAQLLAAAKGLGSALAAQTDPTARWWCWWITARRTWPPFRAS